MPDNLNIINKNRELKKRQAIRGKKKIYDEADKRLKETSNWLPFTEGFLEAQGNEKRFKLTQQEIADAVPLSAARKEFALDLELGPYYVDASSNGRFVCLGGAKGHLAMFDRNKYKLMGEIQISESIKGIKFLHDHTMIVAVQKRYPCIYDNQMKELHALHDLQSTYGIDYLPYHFLLALIGEFGVLSYLDISTGECIAKLNTKRGPCHVISHNPYNNIIGCGHTKGTVTLWSPATSKPIAEIFAHTSNVSAIMLDGYHMVSSGMDGFWRTWDLRMMKTLEHHATRGKLVTNIKLSTSKKLLAISFASHLQFWENPFAYKNAELYLDRNYPGELINDISFVPLEDLVLIGRPLSVSSILVPGAGIANYDFYEACPFDTAKNRQNRQIRQLLEKLPPETISMEPNIIGRLKTKKDRIEKDKPDELQKIRTQTKGSKMGKTRKSVTHTKSVTRPTASKHVVKALSRFK